MVEAENNVTGASAPVMTIPAVLPAGMERRRPGRREHVDPALIPLLRRKPDAEATLPSLELEEDRLADLGPSRGIVVGIFVSIVIWFGAVLGLMFVLR